ELGRWSVAELPSPDRGRLVGSTAPARGCGPDLCRARGEHRLLRRNGRRSDGQELVCRGGRRREGAARAPHGAPKHRGRLRRLPGHAELAGCRRCRSIGGSSLERTGYLGPGMAEGPNSTTTSAGGEGTTAAAPARAEDNGRARGL